MAVLLKRLCDNEKHCLSVAWPSKNFLITHNMYAPSSELKPKVVGNCNRMFCLEYDDGKLSLWCPWAADRLVWVPPPPPLKPPLCPYPNCDKSSTFCSVHVLYRVGGLGFDPRSGDYKVVRFVDYVYEHRAGEDCDLVYPKQVQVYSVKGNCWRGIHPGESENWDIIDEFSTCVDGFCYWKARDNMGNLKDTIVSLDLAEEKFSTLTTMYLSSCDSFILIELQGLLGVVIYDTDKICKKFVPWVVSDVIKDGEPEWIRAGFTAHVVARRPLGYCRNGEVLLLEGYDSKLLVYDSLTQALSKIDEIHDYPLSMQLFPCKREIVEEQEETSLRKEKLKRDAEERKRRCPRQMLKRKRGEMLRERESRRESLLPVERT